MLATEDVAFGAVLPLQDVGDSEQQRAGVVFRVFHQADEQAAQRRWPGRKPDFLLGILLFPSLARTALCSPAKIRKYWGWDPTPEEKRRWAQRVASTPSPVLLRWLYHWWGAKAAKMVTVLCSGRNPRSTCKGGQGLFSSSSAKQKVYFPA
jgi:hypothetical protein